MTVFVAILGIATYAGFVHTVLPPQCLANFRWDDCGKPPRTVIYYWRVGSRCEVGIWRGCLPNINMFRDEYECVSTCTFSVRAQEQDFHKLNEIEEDSDSTSPNIYDDYDNSTNENDVVDSTTAAADNTTVDTPDKGDEKNDKEEGTDGKTDENEKEKDGEKDTPDEEGKDSATESQAVTESAADTENENAEEPEEPGEPEEPEEPEEEPTE